MSNKIPVEIRHLRLADSKLSETKPTKDYKDIPRELAPKTLEIQEKKIKASRRHKRQSYTNLKDLIAASKGHQLPNGSLPPVKGTRKLRSRSKSDSSRVVNEESSEEKYYKHGTLEKSSEKQISKSKSSSSLPPSEELNIDSSSVVVKETPSSKNEPMEKKNKDPTRLFPVIEQPKTKSKGYSLFGKKSSVKLPAGFRGGRKTAKRRRAKKSCGWF
jgi:hypothetical protein